MNGCKTVDFMWSEGGCMMDFLFSKKKGPQIISISVDSIRPNPYQPRKHFDEAALKELSESIKQYGVLQPISVRKIGSTNYELIAGERRLRATKMAGLSTITAMVVEMDDESSAIVAMIENLQRQDLNFLEEAEGYLTLLQDYNLTQEELAQKVGKTQSTIANKLRILKLPLSVKKIIQEHQLTERHARALLKLPDEEMQLAILQEVIHQELNVKATEALIDRTLQHILEERENKKEQKVKRVMRDIRLFMNTINQAVSIMKQSGIEAKYTTHEGEDSYEVRIKIPYK